MTDARRTKPGIKPRYPMDIPPVDLGALSVAFDTMLIARKPARQKRRNGLRLLIRRVCYAILART